MAERHDDTTPRSIPEHRTTLDAAGSQPSGSDRPGQVHDLPDGGSAGRQAFPHRQPIGEARWVTHEDGRQELWNPEADVERHGPWLDDLVTDSLGNIADGLLLIEDLLWIDQGRGEAVELADGTLRTVRRLARCMEAALRRQAGIVHSSRSSRRG